MINKKIKLLSLTFLALYMTSTPAFADTKTNATIHVFDTQFSNYTQAGDAIIISHGKEHLLIDGGSISNGPKLVKYIKDNNIKNIDILMTHWHGDHIGGLTYLLEQVSAGKLDLKIGKFYGKHCPTATEVSKYYVEKEHNRSFIDTYHNRLYPAMKKLNIKLTLPKDGEPISMLGGTVTFYNTNFKAVDGKKMSINDQSIIVKYTHGNDKLLFAADITVDAENQVLSNNNKYKDPLEAMDFVKIPHHGRKGSSSVKFLNTILKKDTKYPTVSVLTSTDNIIEPYVLAKYTVRNSPIYSIANNGDITVTSKGDKKIESKNITTTKKKATLSVANAYVKYNNIRYYFTKNKITENTLLKINLTDENQGFTSDYPTSGTKYIAVNKNNEIITGWQKIKNDYYYFSENGLALTGLQKLTRDKSTNYYLLDTTGKALTGWQKTTINGKTTYYYFNKGAQTPENKGKLLTGKTQLITINNGKDTYGVNSDGSMITSKNGVVTINGSKYLFDSEGKMLTGWQKTTINGKTAYYYFTKGAQTPENKGKLLTGKTQLITINNGKDTYGVNSDGSMITSKNGVVTINGSKYLFDSEGKILTGWQKTTINGKTAEYYFIKGVQTPENKGKLLTGKATFLTLDNGKNTYYVNKDGSKFTGKSLTINNKTYNFNTSTGKCLNYK